jgi:hypothetical protein
MVYSVYGLRVESSVALPGLLPSDHGAAPDVILRIQSDVTTLPPADSRQAPWYRTGWRHPVTGQPALTIHRVPPDGGFHFHYVDGVHFVVDAAGGAVTAWASPRSTVADISSYLAGPVAAFLLRMRGVIALHASVVDLGWGSIAFAGDVGAGKSTTAAMFTRLGHSVVTEDVAPLRECDGEFRVLAGATDVALCADAVEMLYGSPDALEPFSANWDKRRLDLRAPGALTLESSPLAAVYVLGERTPAGSPPRLEPLARRDAVVQLLGNVYGSALLHDALRARELDVLSRLARTVPVRAALPCADPARLRHFCEAVLADARALCSPPA